MSVADDARIDPAATRLDRRADRRADPWGDFLRRILLTASIAGTALPAAAVAVQDDAAPVEVSEPDHPAQPVAAVDPAGG